MKKLFVAYTYSGNEVSGNGNCIFDIEDDEVVENIEDVRQLQAELEKIYLIKGVIINNIIRFPIG